MKIAAVCSLNNFTISKFDSANANRPGGPFYRTLIVSLLMLARQVDANFRF